jgi:mannosyltransferase
VWRAWLKAVAGGFLLAAPVIVYGVLESGQIAYLAERNATTLVTTTVTPWFGNTQLAIIAWALIVAAVIVAGVGLVRARRVTGAGREMSTAGHGPSLVVLSLVWLIAPATILISIDSVHALYTSRYLSFATPSAALLIGWPLSRVRRWWVAGVPLLVFAVAAAPSYLAQRTPYAQNNSDWAVVATFIHTHASLGDAIVFDESARPSRRPRLALRMYPAEFTGLKDVTLKSPWWATDRWYDTTFPLESVVSRLDGVSRVWLIEARWPGEKPASFDLSTLSRLGFTTVHRYQEHSDVIVELTR